MRTCSRIRWAAGLLAAWLLAGCAEEARILPPAETAAATAKVRQGHVPFDVQKIMEQVHFAFRPRGPAWEGEHSTYKVRVEAGGFSVTPFHHPQGQAEGAGAAQSSPEQRGRRLESPSPEYVEGQPVRFGLARVTRGGRMLASHVVHGRVEDSGGLTLARGEVAEHFRNSAGGVEQSWSIARPLDGAGELEVRVPVQSGRFLGETAGGLHFVAGSGHLGVRYGHGTWVDAAGHRTAVPSRFEAGAIVLRVPEQVLEASAYPAVLDPIVSPELGMDTPVYGAAEYNQTHPTVSSDGTNFLVVWEDARSGGSDIYGARVSGTGQVLDKSGIAISIATALSSQSSPAVAHDGTNFLVVWQVYRQDNFDLRGARVDSNGTVLDLNGGIAISTTDANEFSPSVAHTGTSFLVVWERSQDGDSDIHGARVDSAGTVLDPNGGIAISIALNNQSSPVVTHGQTSFLVVWEDSRGGVGSFDIRGARVDGSGVVLDANGIIIAQATGKQSSPAVAYDGTNFLVVWEDYRNGNADIYGARVSHDGVVLDPWGIAIYATDARQSAPAVAHDGVNFLVVWEGYYYGPSNPNIVGALVSGSGSVLKSGFSISEAAGKQLSPAVAHGGTNFLVVWEDSRSGTSSDIYGTRVDGSGEVLDSGGLVISQSANGQYTPVVAHDGENFLVVWVDHRSGTGDDLYGARVNGSGEVLDTNGIALSTAAGNQTAPAVAYNGTHFLVVWEDSRNGNADIYKTRVARDGGVLAPGGAVVSIAAGNQIAPAVAYNGTHFLVVWEDYRNGDADIYKTRVTRDGDVLAIEGAALSTADGDQSSPAVAVDGMNFLVVWEDYRSGNGLSDIYGARVNGSGEVLDTIGVPISTADFNQSSPAVAYDGTSFLVVWEDSRDGTGFSDIYGARVSSTGSVLDSSGIAISTASYKQSSPAVAYDGTSSLVVWEDARGGNGFSDIYGARVSDTGAMIGTEFSISTDPLAEREPMLTSMGGGRSLVVYRSSEDSATLNSERVMARTVQSP